MRVVPQTVLTRIPLLDLAAQHSTIRSEVMEAVGRVIDSQQFVLGAEVLQLEEEIAAYCQCRFAIGCASGTDALILALAALDIGAGDEVITTPYSFFATVSAIVKVGAMPVFADIDAGSYNLDAAQLEELVCAHPKAKAILPVHLFGACAEMDAVLDVAERHGLAVIEDAAQSIGAEWHGRRSGSMGTIGCFSFFPSKNLGGWGDGGMLTTGDARLARRLKSLRVHGSEVKYYHDEVGWNSRLDALQAAVLRVKLRHLDKWTAARQANAAAYLELFQERGVPVKLPRTADNGRHVWNQFTIRSARRDELREHLAGKGIGSEIYYPLPLHMQKCFEFIGVKEGSLPVAEAVAREALSLPVYPEVGLDNLRRVVNEIAGFHGC
jgi:dTDP-4-amino-4,6-dideoxygalactose transaminase